MPQVLVISLIPFASGKSKLNISIPIISPAENVTVAACFVLRNQKYPMMKTAEMDSVMLEPMEFTIPMIDPPLAPATKDNNMEKTIIGTTATLPIFINLLSDVPGHIVFTMSRETRVAVLLLCAVAVELINASRREAPTSPTKPMGSNS